MALAEWWNFLFSFFFFTRRSRIGGGARKLAVGLTGTFAEPNRHRNKSFYYADTYRYRGMQNCTPSELNLLVGSSIMLKKISVDYLGH